MPHSANSRPVTFALWNQFREQIQAMLKDGVLQESHLAYINIIFLVVREGKSVRICLDVRRINKQMVADHTKACTVIRGMFNFNRPPSFSVSWNSSLCDGWEIWGERFSYQSYMYFVKN